MVFSFIASVVALPQLIVSFSAENSISLELIVELVGISCLFSPPTAIQLLIAFMNSPTYPEKHDEIIAPSTTTTGQSVKTTNSATPSDNSNIPSGSNQKDNERKRAAGDTNALKSDAPTKTPTNETRKNPLMVETVRTSNLDVAAKPSKTEIPPKQSKIEINSKPIKGDGVSKQPNTDIPTAAELKNMKTVRLVPNMPVVQEKITKTNFKKEAKKSTPKFELVKSKTDVKLKCESNKSNKKASIQTPTNRKESGSKEKMATTNPLDRKESRISNDRTAVPLAKDRSLDNIPKKNLGNAADALSLKPILTLPKGDEKLRKDIQKDLRLLLQKSDERIAISMKIGASLRKHESVESNGLNKSMTVRTDNPKKSTAESSVRKALEKLSKRKKKIEAPPLVHPPKFKKEPSQTFIAIKTAEAAQSKQLEKEYQTDNSFITQYEEEIISKVVSMKFCKYKQAVEVGDYITYLTGDQTKLASNMLQTIAEGNNDNHIAYVSHNDCLPDMFTVCGLLFTVAACHGINVTQKQVDYMLGAFNMQNLAKSTIDTLTDSERCILTLIAKILCKPTLVILDQMDMFLPHAKMMTVWALCSRLRDDRVPVLFTSKNSKFAEHTCTRVAHMYKCQFVAIEPPQCIKKRMGALVVEIDMKPTDRMEEVATVIYGTLKDAMILDGSLNTVAVSHKCECPEGYRCPIDMEDTKLDVRYEVKFIRPDGSSIFIPSSEPKQIFQAAIDLNKLSDEERRQRLAARKPKAKAIKQEIIDDNFDEREYMKFWASASCEEKGITSKK
ncbi:unnamed protein product [Caenorhabditis bovis]|uniref:Uncharacterized protein n=1 Tax=Caenorhabditis bovis TaxID=2654633 RepID=A0A8S1F563_9PELO|nr:unnamed protein product [Caenorhabditis bovis]